VLAVAQPVAHQDIPFVMVSPETPAPNDRSQNATHKTLDEAMASIKGYLQAL